MGPLFLYLSITASRDYLPRLSLEHSPYPSRVRSYDLCRTILLPLKRQNDQDITCIIIWQMCWTDILNSILAVFRIPFRYRRHADGMLNRFPHRITVRM